MISIVDFCLSSDGVEGGLGELDGYKVDTFGNIHATIFAAFILFY